MNGVLLASTFWAYDTFENTYDTPYKKKFKNHSEESFWLDSEQHFYLKNLFEKCTLQ